MRTKEYQPVYTLITGASTGLGRELAVAFSKLHRNLILVALPGRNLPLICKELEHQFGIRAVAFEVDLTDFSALRLFVDAVLQNFSVDRLINNAGMGGTLRFTEAAPEYLEKIIDLNIRATTILTRLLLPELIKHSGALIINIASMAAFGPLPYKTIYPASKAFIYSFSRSLNYELKNTGVKVIVVHPGQIITNHDVTLRIIKQGLIGKIGLLACSDICSRIIKAIEKDKEVVIPGFFNHLNRLLIRFIPEKMRLSAMADTYRKEFALKNSFN